MKKASRLVRNASRETILIDSTVYRLCKKSAPKQDLKLYEFINIVLAEAVGVKLDIKHLRHLAKVERDVRKQAKVERDKLKKLKSKGKSK